MKDKYEGNVIREFIGLRLKKYSILFINGTISKFKVD